MAKNNIAGFAAGFSSGLFIGVMGYFLFATKEGEQAREALKDEWETTKLQLKESGVKDDPEQTIRELAFGFKKRIARLVESQSDQGPGTTKSKQRGKSSLQKTPRTSPANPKQFKGV